MRRLLAATLVAGCAGLLFRTEALLVIQQPVSDALIRLVAPAHPTPPPGLPEVTIVAIDARSLRAHSQDWPWPRRSFATAIQRLDEAGARAIGLDVDLSSAGDPADDHRLSRAISRSGRVVLSTHRELQQLSGRDDLDLSSMPLPRLAKGAAGIGAPLIGIDPDGIVRNAFRTRVVGGDRVPSISEAILKTALRVAALPVGPEEYPIDFRRARPGVPTISIIDVLEGRFDPRDVAGRIVLIGATAAEFEDLWPTPVGPNRPGVWIHALALRTRLAEIAGDPVLSRPDPATEIAVLCLVSLLGAAVGRTRWRLPALAGMASSLPAIALFVLAADGLLLDPILPQAVVAAHYALGLETVRRHLGERLLERELSLATLFRVGAEASGSTRSDGYDVALGMLAEVVGASGVALLYTNENGELDQERIAWAVDDREVGDLDAATMILSDRQMKIFENFIPGSARPRGSAIYTPLFSGDSPVGVLVVEQDVAAPPDDMQLRTIATVGTQLALSVQNLRLLEQLRETFRSSISALASAVEARDGYTEMHCRRLAVFSSTIAERLGLPTGEIEAIELGALLHDVGKVGIRDDVLLKDGRLSQDERDHIEDHPAIGDQIVSGIKGISPTTVGCVRHHHERWNGTGYPDGLAGEAIPLGARIIALVDVWDALSSPRPYKYAHPQQQVREILRKDSGERFEPALVDLFFEILDDEGEEMIELIERTSEGIVDHTPGR